MKLLINKCDIDEYMYTWYVLPDYEPYSRTVDKLCKKYKIEFKTLHHIMYNIYHGFPKNYEK